MNFVETGINTKKLKEFFDRCFCVSTDYSTTQQKDGWCIFALGLAEGSDKKEKMFSFVFSMKKGEWIKSNSATVDETFIPNNVKTVCNAVQMACNALKNQGIDLDQSTVTHAIEEFLEEKKSLEKLLTEEQRDHIISIGADEFEMTFIESLIK
jgi:hypothetical protein